jgi:hypothetical protein
MYSQVSGEWRKDNKHFAYGWSGFEDGINIPAMQNIPYIGPIPCGAWKIIGPPVDDPETGKYTLIVVPDSATQIFGRNSFRLHGRSAAKPFDSSKGCLVLELVYRQQVWGSGDTNLLVVPEFVSPPVL